MSNHLKLTLFYGMICTLLICNMLIFLRHQRFEFWTYDTFSPMKTHITKKVALSSTSLCQRRSGLISIAHDGRLGNQLGEYASLLAASKVINATPVISEDMKNKLYKVFPYFTIPSLKCPNTTITWTHIGLKKIQNLTIPISKQTLLIFHYYCSY